MWKPGQRLYRVLWPRLPKPRQTNVKNKTKGFFLGISHTQCSICVGCMGGVGYGCKHCLWALLRPICYGRPPTPIMRHGNAQWPAANNYPHVTHIQAEENGFLEIRIRIIITIWLINMTMDNYHFQTHYIGVKHFGFEQLIQDMNSEISWCPWMSRKRAYMQKVLVCLCDVHVCVSHQTDPANSGLSHGGLTHLWSLLAKEKVQLVVILLRTVWYELCMDKCGIWETWTWRRKLQERSGENILTNFTYSKTILYNVYFR